jgi:phosphate transport system permease protein
MADREAVARKASGQHSEQSAARHRPGSGEPLPPPSIAGEAVTGEAIDIDYDPDIVDRLPDPGPDTPAAIASSEPLGVSALDDIPVSGAGSIAGSGRARLGDRVFAGLTAGAGGFIVILIALVAAFLLIKVVPAIGDDKVNFLFSREWKVDDTTNLRFGILGLLWVTVIISLVGMVIAVPLAIGIALFITQYAPRPLVRPVAYVIDLLAAIPSIIYGIWGIIVLAPYLEPVQRVLYHLGFLKIFEDVGISRGTIFNGGVVLAIMILPIITAISRDVFERTPRANIEAAWALGATKWEMIRLAVLPHGRPGVISGAMLGLGRALGETIAIYLIVSRSGEGAPFSFSIFSNGETFASKIANNAAEFNDPTQTGAYIAAGLALFVLTFAVNAIARWIVNRRKEFS